ncbi:MAG: diguanylate cyclase [Calditerrivibrio sp.]|nr:diguanylate cyclase [Calditerrivibrio sp.]
MDANYELFLTNDILFDKSIVPMIFVDDQRVIRKVNQRFLQLFGYEKEEVMGKQTSILTPSVEYFHEYRKYFERTKSGFIQSNELLYKKKDGGLFWVKLTGVPILIEGVEYVLWSFEDITYEVEIRNKLYESNKELETIFEKVKVGLVYVVDNKIKKVNPFFLKIIGDKEENILDKRIEAFLPCFYDKLPKCEVKFLQRDDNIIYTNVDMTEIVEGRYIIIFEDVSDHVKERNRLKYLSETDDLTKVLNRRSFVKFATETLLSKNYDRVSLAIIDIDRFKDINDTYGHDVGDEVLIDIANFIKNQLRENEIFGRLGGEEFGICFPIGKEIAYNICERVRMKMEKALFSSKKISVKVSIGISDNTLSNVFEELYKRADQCLYRAKNSGRNRVVVADQLSL